MTRNAFGYLLVKASVAVAVLAASGSALAQDALVLGEVGKSNYQIVLPDVSPDETVAQCLVQTGRLVRAAFAQNGMELPVVAESERDQAKPGIFLGDTVFARSQGVDTSKLRGWNYVMKAAGPNLILAGNDNSPPTLPDGIKVNAFYRLGTLKAVLDFLREYAGTYFLYPTNRTLNGLPSLNDRRVREWNLTDTAGIEYKPTRRIEVPADLDLHKRFFIGFQKKTLKYAELYDVASNCLPPVDDAALHHTYHLAVPPDKYREEHPEYFALIGGERVKASGSGSAKDQYCLSNPGFQEVLYEWHSEVLRQGFNSVHILQPDGFRPCQCEECSDLYGVSDWGEKLWIFHRNLAERLNEEHPGKKLVVHAYALTSSPPKSFDTFPENVSIYVQGTDFDSFDRWGGMNMPGGFYAGIHNWIPNQTGRYVPMRTPLFVERQVKNFHKHNVQGVNWDGLCYVYGLEGPVLYVYGRMFDDPENLRARDLMREFCEVAFDDAAASMLRFYDRLYDGIELYSFYLGTHGVGWSYSDIYGRRHKHVRDPFQMLGFLYTPKLLAGMEKDLVDAEKKAAGAKVKARLDLVRREFEYVKSLATVIHLYQAFSIRPTKASRDRLLDAIDERNALVDGYYEQEGRWSGRPKDMAGWDTTLFPPPGHSAAHVRLEYNRYQESFADTCLNWDTEKVRNSPLPGTNHMEVLSVAGPVTLDSEAWQRTQGHELAPQPGERQPSVGTMVKVLHDQDSLYVLVESEFSGELPEYPPVGRDGDLSGKESVGVYIAPIPGQEVYYSFRVGTNPGSWFDAANGLIADPLNLLYGRDDPNWNGDWSRSVRVEPAKNRWLAMLTIPFQSMNAEPPKAGDSWRANFVRIHPAAQGRIERVFWSVSGAIKNVGEKAALGDIEFAAPESAAEATEHPSKTWRENYYRKTFRIPEQWKDLSNQLPDPIGQWLFRPDELAKGVRENWQAPDLDESEWSPIHVPGFWKEIGFDYQGFGWYRVTFRLPEQWKGKAVQVMFAGVDEQAWVYVNGKLLREHTLESEGMALANIWQTPFVVNVSADDLEYEGANVLAVRVKNDAGSGGLWRPVIVRAADAE